MHFLIFYLAFMYSKILMLSQFFFVQVYVKNSFPVSVGLYSNEIVDLVMCLDIN